MSERATITVFWPDRGYGFAKPNRVAAADLYVHVDDVVKGVLSLGAQIECDIVNDRQNRGRCARVRVL